MAYVSKFDGTERGDRKCHQGHPRCSTTTNGDCSRETCEKGHLLCSARPNGHCGEIKRAPRGKAFRKGADPRRSGLPLKDTHTGDETTMAANTEGYQAGDRCPKCNDGTLREKKGINGPFLGCDQFPRCRFSRSIAVKTQDEAPVGEAVEVRESHEGARPVDTGTVESKAKDQKAEGKGEGKGGEQGEGEGEGEQSEGEGGEGEGEGEGEGPPPPMDPLRAIITEIADTVSKQNDLAVLETVQEALDEMAKAGTLKAEVKHVTEIKLNDEVLGKVEGTEQHAAFKPVVEALLLGLNVLLVGPAGCGKTHLAEQVSKALGLRFGSLSCTAGMSESQLTGRLLPMGERGIYLGTQFVDFYENGGLFLLDEIDASDANVLLVINQALANGHLPLPNRLDNPVALKHKDFKLVAAANTFGHGADRIYVGRNQLDGASLDRFACGEFSLDYDRGVEKMLCPDDALLAKWWGIREKARSLKLRRIVSTRGLMGAHKLRAGAKYPVNKAVRRALESWTQEDRLKVGVTD